MHILMLAKTTLNRQAIRQAKESTQERLEREHDPCETYEAVVDQGSAEKEKKKSCVAPFFISSLKSQRQHAIVFFFEMFNCSCTQCLSPYKVTFEWITFPF